MVDQAVDDAFGAHFVLEHFAPVAESSIRCDDRAGALIAGVEDIEDVLALFLVAGQPAKLVDDEEGGFGIKLHGLVDAMVGLGGA